MMPLAHGRQQDRASTLCVSRRKSIHFSGPVQETEGGLSSR
jgi:hypothetical protein